MCVPCVQAASLILARRVSWVFHAAGGLFCEQSQYCRCLMGSTLILLAARLQSMHHACAPCGAVCYVGPRKRLGCSDARATAPELCTARATPTPISRLLSHQHLLIGQQSQNVVRFSCQLEIFCWGATRASNAISALVQCMMF